MVLRAVRKASFIIGCLLVLLIGLWHALAWKQIDEAKRDADVVLEGSIVSADLSDTGDRVDATEPTPLDAYHLVRFEVASVRKGAWAHPDFGVLVHSPSSAFFPRSAPGDRHLLFLRQPPDGGTRWTLDDSRPCAPLLWPCGW